MKNFIENNSIDNNSESEEFDVKVLSWLLGFFFIILVCVILFSK